MQTRFSRSPARGLYLITPDEPDDGALFAALRTALAARPVLVQYRNKALDRVASVLTTVPADFSIHKTLQRILDARKAMFATGEGFDWATAEAMAFGSLTDSRWASGSSAICAAVKDWPARKSA